MKIILATSNKGKIREIKKLMPEHEVIPYSEIIDEFEIIEDGDSFKENAIIKAETIYKKLADDSIIVIADDSGISIDALDGAPGIYSARYAGENASDKDNLYHAIDELKKINKSTSKAHYTAAIAITDKNGTQSVHGWFHGTVITKAKGDKGFGYDPMFIPDGMDKTLGELDDDIKKKISHRSSALEKVKIILDTI